MSNLDQAQKVYRDELFPTETMGKFDPELNGKHLHLTVHRS
jgi:hypothetical protein